MFQREIKALVSITFTVGLPWLIILGATIPAIAQLFQWLFIIITFLQGKLHTRKQKTVQMPRYILQKSTIRSLDHFDIHKYLKTLCSVYMYK